jgi:hypothetical protein
MPGRDFSCICHRLTSPIAVSFWSSSNIVNLQFIIIIYESDLFPCVDSFSWRQNGVQEELHMEPRQVWTGRAIPLTAITLAETEAHEKLLVGGELSCVSHFVLLLMLLLCFVLHLLLTTPQQIEMVH